jgi:hypothetical protein
MTNTDNPNNLEEGQRYTFRVGLTPLAGESWLDDE